MIRVFVGSADPWAEHEPVLAYSILKNSSKPVQVDFIRPGECGMNPSGCTGFTNVRYAVPQIAKHAGFAIYLDVDMLVLGDIADLWKLREKDKWVRLKDGADEVSVIDCAAPNLPLARQMHMFQKWHLREMVDAIAVNKIPPAWNVEDTTRKGMKLLHFTDLKRQPWFHEHPDEKAVALLKQYQDEAAKDLEAITA